MAVTPTGRPTETPVFRTSVFLCPKCFGKGQTVAASDREVDLVCNTCGREWTAERQRPLTPYKSARISRSSRVCWWTQ